MSTFRQFSKASEIPKQQFAGKKGSVPRRFE
jgi:hypothetical protein